MRTIKLPVHGIELSLKGGGSITCSPDLYELCPHCGNKNCCYQCDESQSGEIPEEGLRLRGEPQVSNPGDDEATVASRLQYNGAVDGILSMILAHAIADIDVESPAYLEGIETAFQAAADNL